MDKQVKLFEDYTKSRYFNHWDKVFSMAEFIAYFVDKVGTFDMDEVRSAMEKHGFDDETTVAWVSRNDQSDDNRGASVDNYNGTNSNPEVDIDDLFIDGQDGFVVPEINDGKDSFLFVVKKQAH